MAMTLHRDLGSLMTLNEWVALPEDDTYRYQLQEGVLLVSPRAVRRHQLAAHRLSQQLDGQLPVGRLAASDVLLAVEIIPPGARNVDLHLKPYEYAEAGIPTAGSSTSTRPPRLSRYAIWVHRMSGTSKPQRPPMNSSRPRRCISPRWSPRVPRGHGGHCVVITMNNLVLIRSISSPGTSRT